MGSYVQSMCEQDTKVNTPTLLKSAMESLTTTVSQGQRLILPQSLACYNTLSHNCLGDRIYFAQRKDFFVKAKGSHWRGTKEPQVADPCFRPMASS